MAATVEETLENIKYYVEDDNRIVTCKWLSITLQLNINFVKRALYTFVVDQRDKGGNDDINVTYFVAGLGQSKEGEPMHKCVVVPETDLDIVKKSLSVVTSCHVYSVQKAKLKDYVPLYMTDYEVINEHPEESTSYSSIKCPWATKREERSAPSQPEKQKTPVKVEKKALDSNADAVTEATSGSGGRKTDSKKGSIANMFAAAGKKRAGPGAAGAEKGSKAEEQKENKAKPAEKKGVAAFFGKGDDSGKKGAKDSKKAPAVAQSKISPKDTKPSKKSKKKQVSDDEDDGPSRKRRRRVRTDLFDSSDEEEEERRASSDEEHASEPEEEKGEEKKEEPKDREDSPINISPDEETTGSDKAKEKDSPIVERKTEGGRKRKRTKKVVSKQYIDEEGFMVTKKEVEWLSESDHSADEGETQEQPPAKESKSAPGSAATTSHSKVGKAGGKAEPKSKATGKKVPSPQKGKQTTMMSFFKKK